MSLPPDLPVVDHHCHLSPNGEGVEAARRFHRAGGSHLFLATQNYEAGTPTTLDAYRAQFATTEALARLVHEQTGVVVYPVLAPYPVDLIAAIETLGPGAARDLHCAALDLAARRVQEQAAVALGEIGRPHFPVDASIATTAEEVFLHALEAARDVGCPALVHSEDLDGDGFRSLATLARRASFPVGRLIKHYARSVVPAAERGGIAPSFLARRDLVASSLAEPSPWFWETDFLDDPLRRGAVLDLATVPRRAEAVASAPDGLERLRVPFVDAVTRVYGFTPAVDRSGARP